MNEPSSFVDGRPAPAEGCDNTRWNNPPYLPGNSIFYLSS